MNGKPGWNCNARSQVIQYLIINPISAAFGRDGERNYAVTYTAFLGGEVPVICPTIAFGGGVEIKDRRSFLHDVGIVKP
jgi:hypothetical protein